MHHSGHTRAMPMSTPPGTRLMNTAVGNIHHSAVRSDSVRKRLAEAVKSKTTHGARPYVM